MAKQGTPSCKEERGKCAIIKEYIKKHPISFAMIVGVLSSLITIYQCWISPEDKVRNKIESHVCVIRDTFNCKDINEKGKVNQDVKNLCKKMNSAIEQAPRLAITSDEYNFPSTGGHIRAKALPYKLEYVSNNDFLYAVCLPENEEYEDNVEEIYIDFEILTTEQQRKILDCLDIDFDNMNESFTKKTSSKSEEEVRTSTDKLYDKEKIIIDSLLNGNIENDIEEDESTISIEIIKIGKPLFCKEMPFYVDGFDEMMEGIPVRLDYDKEDSSLYVAFVPTGDYVFYYDCEFPFKELDQEEQEIIFKKIKFKS